MKLIKYLLLIIVTVVVDQFSKYLVVTNFDLFEKMELIPGVLDFQYVQNTGAGFSILEGRMIFFYIITVLALIFLVYLFFKADEKAWLEKLAIALMIGGALGNFIDRLRLEYVVDFIAVNIFGYHFPVFNLADSFLTIGVFFFIISILKGNKHESV